MNKPLLEKMLQNPLDFNSVDFATLIDSYKSQNNKFDVQQSLNDFRECIRHIYDLNEVRLRETSNANLGILGKLNRRSTKIRQKRYFKRVENQKPDMKYIKIYAEGDSWFLFPTFVKDIIDWLERNENYLIFSDAYGGDWITNILYEGQYVEALTIHSPDVFLISGGGNDLVGNERMAVMVSTDKQKLKHTQQSLVNIKDEYQKNQILLAQKYITKEFYSFIWIMKAQYTMIFNGIYNNTNKFKDMISITHGYAYPYPKKGLNFSWKYPLQPIVNSFLKSGKWLFRPLMIKGIHDEEIQHAIMTTLIYEYNEMLRDIESNFENVYHVDCSDIPKAQEDWYDELHLKSDKYKVVASRYSELINSKMTKRR
ncbi:MAG: hypothetical protein JNL49_08495 [Bacteroidia bacterium]|nr:hypothetical protein [Bacteroidia bacterium]